MWTLKLCFLTTFTFFLCGNLFTPSLSSPILCHPDDKRALVKVLRATFDVYYRQFLNHSSQLYQPDCCKWKHIVECDPTSHRVTNLIYVEHYIPYGEIREIPEAIGDLTYLTTLELHKLFRLSGQIPEAISKLVNLRGLYLTWTNLSGPVPSFLGQLKNLEDLDLSFNQLSGSIPPSLSDLTKLQNLNLGRNHLTGSIPESFGSFKSIYFNIFDLSNNELSGLIPRTIGDGKYPSIDFSRNQLSGDALFLMGKDNKLNNINISRNMLEFNLSEAVFYYENMSLIDLSHNKIYGSIPAPLTVSNTSFMTDIYFNVSYNRLCGQIPTTGKFIHLDESCYIHNRCLCGTPLPPCN